MNCLTLHLRCSDPFKSVLEGLPISARAAIKTTQLIKRLQWFGLGELTTRAQISGAEPADAMRAAARIAKNKQVEIDMAEIRFRGERRLGELMAEQRESVGLNHGSRLAGPSATRQDERPTLAEAGIDKHLADRARKFAAIPDDEFDNIVGDYCYARAKPLPMKQIL